MTAAAIIKQARAEGVELRLSTSGKVKASGDQDAVSRWIPIIREHKPEILRALQAANDELRRIVPIVCRAYDCDPAEIVEALQTALGDVNAALESYRLMMQRIQQQVASVGQSGDLYQSPLTTGKGNTA